MRMTDVSIDRPVFMTTVAMAVIVMGLLGLARLGVDLFPEVSFPVVTITTPYPGAGPEEIEAEVTRRMEDAVSSINGVDEVRSYSREGVSQVVVMFELEVDAGQAAADVRDRVAGIRGMLPEDVIDPTITRVDMSAIPVVTYSIKSTRGPLETRRYVDDVVRPALERVDGVGSVTVLGGAEREIRVELRRQAIEALGLPLVAVAQALRGESYDLPAGRLVAGTREVGLKAVGRFEEPRDIEDVVLMTGPHGAQVRIADVGQVLDTTVETRTLTRVDGIPSITLDVQKQGGSNTVAVVDGVAEAVAELEPSLPEGMSLVKIIDSSVFIRQNLAELEEALVLGGLFAIIVIFLFMLDWRSTVISAVALPVSVVATFFVMWLCGFTLNIMSMMGLSLAIGLLIDDSVVVRENIFRHMERGEDPVTAARRGTGEIALAVMATTFTIVAVFGPVAFTGGMIGKFFREFGITVSAAVLVSMLVSFTLDPMMSARVTKAIEPDHHEKLRRHPILGPMVRLLDAIDQVYVGTLAWSLRHRKTVALGAAVAFVGSLALTSLMGQEFNSRGDQGNFQINLELPAGTSLAETDRITSQVEEIVRELPEVVTIATTVGQDEVGNRASVRVLTTPKSERTRSTADMMEVLRPRLVDIPGLTFSMREAGLNGGASSLEEAPVTLVLRGPDYDELGRFAQEAFRMVQGVQGVRDPSITYKPGRPEESLMVDRERAADLGVSFATIASTLRLAVEGEVVGQFREGEQESDIRVQLRPEDRGSWEALHDVPVPVRGGTLVALGNVTRQQSSTTPAAIQRLDRERQITVTANVVDRSLGEVVADITERMEPLVPNPSYSFSMSGEAKRMTETFTNLGIALGLSILFIYFVLAAQFESFLHPLTIMLSLPLAIVGALVGLFIAGFAIGMPALIGIILLMGLVTKNAILLVDFANQRRDQGKEILDALLEAGEARLRPILMTSAAMILGMLPTAVSQGEGSEFRAPMSVAVIGGVITSTLLTLVVVPVFYVWIDRITLRGIRERRARKAAQKAARTKVPSPAE
ncbi:efflux RND transporter permease subunit [Paraliomyxa miuraensis]|uniref:efflux RND transporter permease subunit n=1 Tax=Paraliomyxa miuraensis TaxID=376150 RepID=UPI002258995A|nr:efflux RND transporter permease subunit [Paraliomyxa miuraensis]MCX4246912.1 efflux RND transporter permease subunit [Paraliomyxa miuraensis]